MPTCRFPEKIEDITENELIAVDDKDAREWDQIFRETLECYDLINTCKIAFFNIKDRKATGLGKYDSIKKENFLENRGVNEATADELFELSSLVLKSTALQIWMKLICVVTRNMKQKLNASW